MITFYFQAKDIGGVQVLIFNLIKELYYRNIISKLIYFNESWLTAELEKNNIQVEFYDIEKIKFNLLYTIIKQDDILITTLLLDEFFFLYKTNPTLLFWNVFPTSLKIEKGIVSPIRKFFRKRLIEKMIHKKGLVFMDYSGVNYIKKEYEINIAPNFIQIPINTFSSNPFLTRGAVNAEKRIINLTYLGRAVLWKVTPVLKILSDITICKITDYKIVLHIITDEVDEFKMLLNDNSKSVEIKYYCDLSGEKLKRFLLETSDLHFAMGTSCLDGSSLGIPSILLDASYSDFPHDYKYRWIFENENCSLGELLDETTLVNTGNTMQDILTCIAKSNEIELRDISNKCFEYTKKNHDLKVIIDLFLEACHNSELRVNDLIKNDLFYANKKILNWMVSTYLFKNVKN
jgi:hypothetical protein